MGVYLDLKRIAELQALMGTDLEGIAAMLLTSMSGAIEQVEVALADGQFDRVTQAAHLCRNDALMVGAGQLQEALSELEAAARDSELARARLALDRLSEVWPATREELARAAGAERQP